MFWNISFSLQICLKIIKLLIEREMSTSLLKQRQKFYEIMSDWLSLFYYLFQLYLFCKFCQKNLTPYYLQDI